MMPPAWPYPIRYGRTSRAAADVLVLGGGVAGCFAAISAARQGARVVMVEKAATLRSGAAGTGCDHWLNTPNPASTITAEEVVAYELDTQGGYSNGISRYIAARESYETLLELEDMGGKVRDTAGEFAGAEFRDEGTGFLFAYDYLNRLHFRVWGSTFKPVLYRECRRLGVRIFDRVAVTSLLTEAGAPGARVVGATGLHCRTGEFFVFTARATVNCLSRHQRNFVFSSELRGLASFRPPTNAGDGHAAGWRAGAALTLMEKTVPTTFASGHSFPAYGTGNPYNTWFPCTMVDARGREIPWVDRDGQVLGSVGERTRPAPGQRFIGERSPAYAYRSPDLAPDLEERVRRGEFTLPLYADLPAMPELERRAIWGLMVGEEGKTRAGVLGPYEAAGFDPARDLLQSYRFIRGDQMREWGLAQERTTGEIGDAGGFVVDWALRSTLEGLYVAGDALFAANFYYHAATTGRYAGRQAAAHARRAAEPAPDRHQVEAERARVHAPAGRRDGIEWKELSAAICRVMQNYCSEPKNEELMRLGLLWLADLEASEAPTVCADNPHKLVRTLETFNILTCSQIIVHASLARRASSAYLHFRRLDYPAVDPPDWHRWITVRQGPGGVVAERWPIDYWGPLADGYGAHCRAE
jgi:succinate dehydrogenase/fumarate reductase flavoprotein subunit